MLIDSSDVTMTSCSITSNTADFDGGGMYIYSSDVTMTSCSITSNTAGGSHAASRGGAVYVVSGTASFSGCSFSSNSAPNSGSDIYKTSGATVTVSGCGEGSFVRKMFLFSFIS